MEPSPETAEPGAPARPSAAIRKRHRNPRGQGARLTEDIVAGALALIERTGSAEAVTLRAVAREAGIAAPSIYAHFPDRDAVLMAVVARIFDELTQAIEQGKKSAGQDPVDRLVAGCEAYVAFGLEHPARYSMLFSTQRPATPDYPMPVPIGPDGRPMPEFGAQSFALLVQAIEDCVTAGVSASTDVVADAAAVWVALHGTVTLRAALPRFPWPDPAAFVRQLVLLQAQVTS
ncbi:MAG TPA: TetR/AcrR family transcriptional regulator [Streptosporangiaceae bacterium]|nr:TetR/AcrR family transcriptional regulator [Streptosporangiaceae bacterium]